MPTKTKRPFFASTAHPGLIMNRHGVVLADRSRPEANSETWGASFDFVPLKSGNLTLKQAVEDEATAAGYTKRSVRFYEYVWSKPAKSICR